MQFLFQELEPHVFVFLFVCLFCRLWLWLNGRCWKSFCRRLDQVALLATLPWAGLHLRGEEERAGGGGADRAENTQGDDKAGMDGSSQQPWEGQTGRRVLAKQLILHLCFLAQHPQAWTSHPLTPGEKEAEELWMQHVFKTPASPKPRPPIWKTRGLGSPQPHLPPPSQVRRPGLCLQDVVHIRPRRRRREEDQELQLASGRLASMLWPSCLPPEQQRNRGRSQMRGP